MASEEREDCDYLTFAAVEGSNSQKDKLHVWEKGLAFHHEL